MLYKELKEFIETLSEKQLNQQVVVFNEDEETPTFLMIDHTEVSEEDMYWEHHGDFLGNLEEAKATLSKGQNWDDEKEDFIIQPKGTVTLHS